MSHLHARASICAGVGFRPIDTVAKRVLSGTAKSGSNKTPQKKSECNCQAANRRACAARARRHAFGSGRIWIGEGVWGIQSRDLHPGVVVASGAVENLSSGVFVSR